MLDFFFADLVTFQTFPVSRVADPSIAIPSLPLPKSMVVRHLNDFTNLWLIVNCQTLKHLPKLSFEITTEPLIQSVMYLFL